jgi:hypothetical protein
MKWMQPTGHIHNFAVRAFVTHFGAIENNYETAKVCYKMRRYEPSVRLPLQVGSD